MISRKSTQKSSKKTISNNTLLKSKLSKSKLSKSKLLKSKLSKTKHIKIKRPHTIDKFCGYYKYDINGKINKNLYTSCKINKYCRKYKCQDIDLKMLNAKQNKIGHNYNKIIFDKLKSECPQNITEEDDKTIIKNKKKCEEKALKEIYKNNNMTEIYNKSKECDKIICSKEHNIFNLNLFRQKQIKLKKTKNKKQKTNNGRSELENEVDIDLIKSGDL